MTQDDQKDNLRLSIIWDEWTRFKQNELPTINRAIVEYAVPERQRCPFRDEIVTLLDSINALRDIVSEQTKEIKRLNEVKASKTDLSEVESRMSTSYKELRDDQDALRRDFDKSASDLTREIHGLDKRILVNFTKISVITTGIMITITAIIIPIILKYLIPQFIATQ